MKHSWKNETAELLNNLFIQPCKYVIGYFFPVLLTDDEMSSSCKLFEVGDGR